ncbi:MAG: type I glyceraldehyde-3-phosphate dehydrogenase, partial [Candidatus Falkowbacteria bacterium]|nr:type I glyceraldehyde-3-phosphate dehydrogenase [Candidatus Falkowbacteria bacterium]
YGKFNQVIEHNATEIIVSKKNIKVTAIKNPEELPWKHLKVDIVIEATGIFRTHASAMAHIKAGAKKVIISAPAKACDCQAKDCQVKTVVLGVNESIIKKTDAIISMASCTTNCLAPITKVIKENLGIRKAMMTTIHSYTAGQNLIDGTNKDLRRARAAGLNIVPTTTGAATATCETIPELVGKFDGLAIRVPTAVASLCDIVYLVKKKTTKENINNILIKASKKPSLKTVLGVSDEPLVSSDYIGNPLSGIVDLALTNVIDGDLIKIVAWYDNEWGYSSRLIEICQFIKIKKLI